MFNNSIRTTLAPLGDFSKGIVVKASQYNTVQFTVKFRLPKCPVIKREDTVFHPTEATSSSGSITMTPACTGQSPNTESECDNWRKWTPDSNGFGFKSWEHSW